MRKRTMKSNTCAHCKRKMVKKVAKKIKKDDSSARNAKIGVVMEEFKEGKLHSGSKKGPQVTNPKQAIAIAISESKKKKK